jgi:hypothetical protein
LQWHTLEKGRGQNNFRKQYRSNNFLTMKWLAGQETHLMFLRNSMRAIRWPRWRRRWGLWNNKRNISDCSVIPFAFGVIPRRNNCETH